MRPSRTRSTALLWAKSLLNALLFFSLFMLALPWAAHRLLPVTLPLPALARTLSGGALFVAGIAVWLWGLDAFSRRGRGTPLPADAPRHLVTTGPFGVVRNPIIAAELVVVWGEALYLANAGVLLYALTLSILGHLVVVHLEEPELRGRFGNAYADYCERVPRWLPRLRGTTRRRCPGSSRESGGNP